MRSASLPADPSTGVKSVAALQVPTPVHHPEASKEPHQAPAALEEATRHLPLVLHQDLQVRIVHLSHHPTPTVLHHLHLPTPTVLPHHHHQARLAHNLAPLALTARLLLPPELPTLTVLLHLLPLLLELPTLTVHPPLLHQAPLAHNLALESPTLTARHHLHHLMPPIQILMVLQ